MRRPEQRGLGRGLSALMADLNSSENSSTVSDRSASRLVAIELLRPNPDQPRTDFPEESIEALAASIREKGVIQPLIVREGSEPGSFEIVAGERRWRAAQRANLHVIPVLVRSYSDQEVLEIAIIENIQRVDLNAIEEASGYRQLMERFGYTQEKLSETLSKGRSHIANSVRLLSLPAEVQLLVRENKLSAGHARAIVGRPDSMSLAKKIVDLGLSVRQVETMVRAHGARPSNRRTGQKPRYDKDADTLALEGDLASNLKMNVSIRHEPGGERGTLEITYNTLSDLDALCRILSQVDKDHLS